MERSLPRTATAGGEPGKGTEPEGHVAGMVGPGVPLRHTSLHGLGQGAGQILIADGVHELLQSAPNGVPGPGSQEGRGFRRGPPGPPLRGPRSAHIQSIRA